MGKEIYFCVDLYPRETAVFPHKDCRAESYSLTEKYIRERRKRIITLSLAHLSFDLLDLGYDIYLCYKDRKVKIEEGMKLSNGSTLYVEEQDLLDAFLAGNFDKSLGMNNN